MSSDNLKIAKKAIEDILKEHELQEKLWGEQNHTPERWLSILIEEVGEAAKAFNEGDNTAYREECVQVAAVAMNMIESFDRKESK